MTTPSELDRGYLRAAAHELFADLEHEHTSQQVDRPVIVHVARRLANGVLDLLTALETAEAQARTLASINATVARADKAEIERLTAELAAAHKNATALNNAASERLRAARDEARHYDDLATRYREMARSCANETCSRLQATSDNDLELSRLVARVRKQNEARAQSALSLDLAALCDAVDTLRAHNAALTKSQAPTATRDKTLADLHQAETSPEPWRPGEEAHYRELATGQPATTPEAVYAAADRAGVAYAASRDAGASAKDAAKAAFAAAELGKEGPLQRPPIGVMPRWRWLELRAIDLQGAIERHDREGLATFDWRHELEVLRKEIDADEARRRHLATLSPQEGPSEPPREGTLARFDHAMRVLAMLERLGKEDWSTTFTRLGADGWRVTCQHDYDVSCSRGDHGGTLLEALEKVRDQILRPRRSPNDFSTSNGRYVYRSTPHARHRGARRTWHA